MQEESTNSGTVDNTTNLETENTEASLEVEVHENAQIKTDEYDDKIESIWEQHQKRQEEASKSIEQKRAEEQQRAANPPTLEDGESWQQIYDSMPSSVQRAMNSLRADYTKKTQAVAERRKELEMREASLTNSEAYKQMQQLAARAEEDGFTFDPFNPDSMSSYIDTLVAKQVASILQPLEQEQLAAQARMQRDNFMSEHPDLKTDQSLRMEVYNLLKANENLSLEQAYYMTQGRRAKAMQATQARQAEVERQASRQAASIIGGGNKRSAVQPSRMKNMSAVEIYEYLESQKK